MSVKQSSKLLIDESPLQVLPSLATAIGLNEAIVLQQVHYWLRNAQEARRLDVYRDDRWWVYNSYEDWKDRFFPFWSIDTISRAFKALEKQKLLISGHLSENRYDRRKWYTIDYEAIDNLNMPVSITAKAEDGLPQNDSIDYSKMRGSNTAKSKHVLTEITTETTAKITTKEVAAVAAPPPPPKIIKGSAGKQVKETPEETAWYNARVPVMARACNLDLKVDGAWALCRKSLSQIRHATVEPTPELIEREFVRRDGWWWTVFWKGKDKGDYPEPRDFAPNWQKAMTWRGELRATNTNGHARAAPVSKAQADADRIMAMMFPSKPAQDDSNTVEGRVIRHGN